jgi:hypothetical protein
MLAWLRPGLRCLPEWVGVFSEGLGRTWALTGARVSTALMLPEPGEAEKKANAVLRYSARPRHPTNYLQGATAPCAPGPRCWPSLSRAGANRSALGVMNV